MAILVVAFVGIACTKKKKEAPAPPRVVAGAAPEGALGEILLFSPQSTWQKARTLVGAPMVLPKNLSMMLTGVLGLPPTAAGQFDTDKVVTGLVLETPVLPKPGTSATAPGTSATAPGTSATAPGTSAAPGSVAPVPVVDDLPAHVAISVALKSDDELISMLTLGDKPSFKASQGPLGSTRLSPLPGHGDADIKLAVYGRRLITGDSWEAIDRSASYITTTLVAVPSRMADGLLVRLHERALGDRIAKRLVWRFDELPSNLDLAVDPLKQRTRELSELVKSLKSVHIRVAPSAELLQLGLKVVPKPGGAAQKALASVKMGAVSPLLALPTSSLIAFYAASPADWVRYLGFDVSRDPETQKILESLKALSSTFTGFMTATVGLAGNPTDLAGLLMGGPGDGLLSKLTAVVSVQTADSKASLTRMDTMAKYIEKASVTPIEAAGFGRPKQAVVRLEGKSVGIAWGEQEGQLVIAGGADPKVALERYAVDQTDLSSNAWLGGLVERAGVEASAVLAVQLPLPGPPVGFVCHAGARPELGEVDLYVSAGLIQKAAKLLQRAWMRP